MQKSEFKLNISIIEPVGGHGGMQYYDLGLAYGLESNSGKVVLYTCNDTSPTFDHGEIQYTFGDLWQKHGLAKLRLFFKGYLRSFRLSRNSDIVHFHFFEIGWLNLSVLLLARFYRFKKVMTLHDVDPFVNSTSQLAHRWTYKMVNTIIVHNNFSRNELLKKGVNPKKIKVIPHGNYLPFIHPIKGKEKSNTFNLLFFGQIKDVKGLDILLEGLSETIKTQPNIQLTIAGKPWKSDWEQYQTIIDKFNLQSHVQLRLEYIPDSEVASLFQSCDLVVLPYKRIYQSGVLLLAMSYGRPCLVSDLEPFKEVVELAKAAIIFKSESPNSLSEKILECINHPELLADTTRKANELIKDDYSWTHIGALTMITYRETLSL